MIKTKSIETTEKFDKDGNLTERIIRERTTEDDETRYPQYDTWLTHTPLEVTCKG